MGEQTGAFTKILVPIDGSKPSQAALVKAIHLARIHGASLEIVHVLSVTEDLPREPEPNTRSPSEWVTERIEQIRLKDERMLREAVEEAQGMGLQGQVSSKLLLGTPGQAILTEAWSGSFDLIVIGDRGMSGLRELVLGSVSKHVVDKSTIPVLVVKHSDEGRSI